MVLDAKQKLRRMHLPSSQFSLWPQVSDGSGCTQAGAQKAGQARAEARPQNRDVVIAIDAGHGGEDPGALGPKRQQEKHLVLQIAKHGASINVSQDIERCSPAPVTTTLLTASAQRCPQARADLFVSIHADAFTSAAAVEHLCTLSDRGATSETAKWLAERANQSDLLGGVGDVSLSDKDDVLAHVLWTYLWTATVPTVSGGQSVLNQMGKMTKLHKKQVEQAAFIVLKSPDMPSILVETGFISNPQEARRLSQREHQTKLANAIANGIDQFMRANPPPGTAIAARRQELRHTIARGDTLSEIAARYGVTANALKRRNAIRGDKIRVGQTLFIPGDP